MEIHFLLVLVLVEYEMCFQATPRVVLTFMKINVNVSQHTNTRFSNTIFHLTINALASLERALNTDEFTRMVQNPSPMAIVIHIAIMSNEAKFIESTRSFFPILFVSLVLFRIEDSEWKWQILNKFQTFHTQFKSSLNLHVHLLCDIDAVCVCVMCVSFDYT